MKKKCVFIGVIITLLSFSAGAEEQDWLTAQLIGNPKAPNELTFRFLAAHSHLSTTPMRKQGFSEMMIQWAKAHPDWKIHVETMQGNQQDHARLIEQARAKRAPACSAIDSFQLPVFISQGILKPLDSYFSAEEVDDLFPFIREGIQGEDGHIYAWWWATDLRVMYRNKELIPEAPLTWDATLQALQAVKGKKLKVDPIVFIGGRYEGSVNDFWGHFWSQGGKLIDEEGRPSFGREPYKTYLINGFDFFRTLVKEGYAPKRVSTLVQYNDLNAAAISDTTASFFGGHWQYFQLREAMTEEQFSKWDEVSPLPHMREGLPYNTSTGGWTVGVYTDDKAKQDICASLIRDVFMNANATTAELPTMQSKFDTIEFFNQEPVYARFKELLVDGRARPGVPIYAWVSHELQVAFGQVLTGRKSAKKAIDEAYERSVKEWKRRSQNR